MHVLRAHVSRLPVGPLALRLREGAVTFRRVLLITGGWGRAVNEYPGIPYSGGLGDQGRRPPMG